LKIKNLKEQLFKASQIKKLADNIDIEPPRLTENDTPIKDFTNNCHLRANLVDSKMSLFTEVLTYLIIYLMKSLICFKIQLLH